MPGRKPSFISSYRSSLARRSTDVRSRRRFTVAKAASPAMGAIWLCLDVREALGRYASCAPRLGRKNGIVGVSDKWYKCRDKSSTWSTGLDLELTLPAPNVEAADARLQLAGV